MSEPLTKESEYLVRELEVPPNGNVSFSGKFVVFRKDDVASAVRLLRQKFKHSTACSKMVNPYGECTCDYDKIMKAIYEAFGGVGK